ncbi:MAG TPA: MarR family transcriptional regulator [Steroidobacteraceae bacterium]|nr:MarR family transcriptional regulator [Steroidobacteraceae bacterium]
MASNPRRTTVVASTQAVARRKSKSKEVTEKRPVAPNVFRLGYLIHDVSRMRRRVFDKYMKPEGITRSQWWVLANLSRRGTEAIVTADLAKLLDINKVTLGGLIDRLESAGYVYRRVDKTDRRAKHVFITEAGYALISRMKAITEQLNRQICAGMSQTQIESTERNLALMKDVLREMLVGDEEEVELEEED